MIFLFLIVFFDIDIDLNNRSLSSISRLAVLSLLELELRAAMTTKVSADEGSQYVVVKADDDASPRATSSASEAKDEISQCPEILYKVQYKDYSGEIKGTKELTAPYKLKKTE